MATAAMAVAILQTVPVAAEATSDVEVPIWQDRKCTTCGWIWNPQILEHYRNPAHRNGNPKSQAATAVRGRTGRDLTACSPRHFDICRCRSTDTSIARPAPAPDPRRGHPRNTYEDDRTRYRAREQCNRLSTKGRRQ